MPNTSLLRTGILTGALLLVGCTCAHVLPGSLIDRDLRLGTRLSPVPAVYHIWWRKVEKCSGLSKPMNVAFYAIPKAHFKADTTGLWYLGLYVADSMIVTGRIREKIYIAAPWAYTEWLVMHEMLHALLRGKDTTVTGHPPEFFRVKCQLMSDMHGPAPTPPPLMIPSPIVPIPDQHIPYLPTTP